MMAKVKCPVCEQMLEKEHAEPCNKRYYHADCLVEALSPDDYDKHMFYKRFQRIFNRTLSNIEWIQCDKMIKNDGWTWNKLEDVMEYVYEIEHMDDSDEHGAIGILPYYELRAKKFFQKLWEVQSSETFNTEQDEKEIFCKQVNTKDIIKQKEVKDIDRLWDDEDLMD